MRYPDVLAEFSIGAAHEAGHAVLSHVLSLPFAFAEITRDGLGHILTARVHYGDDRRLLDEAPNAEALYSACMRMAIRALAGEQAALLFRREMGRDEESAQESSRAGAEMDHVRARAFLSVSLRDEGIAEYQAYAEQTAAQIVAERHDEIAHVARHLDQRGRLEAAEIVAIIQSVERGRDRAAGAGAMLKSTYLQTGGFYNMIVPVCASHRIDWSPVGYVEC